MFNIIDRIKSFRSSTPLGSLTYEVRCRIIKAFELAGFPKGYYQDVLICLDDSLPLSVNGVYRPRTRDVIYINPELSWSETASIVAHELVHRQDYIKMGGAKYRALCLPLLRSRYIEPQAIEWEDKVRECCGNNMFQIINRR